MELRSKTPTTLAIIIPMFNEAKGATRCVTQVMRVVPTLEWSTKLIVVDDGSKDRTPTLLKNLKRRFGRSLQIVTHATNQGYGAGLVSGIKLAYKKHYDWCLFMDSDLTNPPSEIVRFIEAATLNETDAVKASRYMRGGHMAGVPYFRRLISQVGNLVGRISYRMGIHDYSNGFRMVKTNILVLIPYTEPGFALILEEMYYLMRMGAKVTEIPSTLTARLGTFSTFRYTPKTFWSYLKYTFKAALVV